MRKIKTMKSQASDRAKLTITNKLWNKQTNWIRQSLTSTQLIGRLKATPPLPLPPTQRSSFLTLCIPNHFERGKVAISERLSHRHAYRGNTGTLINNSHPLQIPIGPRTTLTTKQFNYAVDVIGSACCVDWAESAALWNYWTHYKNYIGYMLELIT